MRTKKILAAVVLVAALASGLGFYWPFGQRPKELRLPGVVEVHEVRLGSKLGGRVKSVHVGEGEVVKAGRVLVRLEAPELLARIDQWEARLAQAEAQWKKAENGPLPQEKAAAKAALLAAKARLARTEKGFREEEVRAAKADGDSAVADLKQAREEHQRVERTFRRGAATRAEYDLARFALERQQGRLNAARARLELLEAGNRSEDKDEARAEVARLEAQWKLLEAGTRYEDKLEALARIKEIRAKLNELKAQLDEAVIRAPDEPGWQGVVEKLLVRTGDLTLANQPAVRVLRATDLWVKVYVPETALGRVKLNQEVAVKVDSHPDRTFQGTVIQIAGESEFTPRNVQSVDERKHQVFGVKVRISDPRGVFKSGMAAEVVVPLSGE